MPYLCQYSTLSLHSPQPGQLDAYKDVLERLNTSIAFKSLDRDLGDTVCGPPICELYIFGLRAFLGSPCRNWREETDPTIYQARRRRVLRCASKWS